MKRERFIVRSIAMGLALVGMLAFAGTASAAMMINVNMDQDTPEGATRTADAVGPAGGADTTWNRAWDQSGITGMLDSDGAATTVDFTHGAGNGDPWSGALTMLVAGRFAWNADEAYNLDISGLAGLKYDLYIASYYPNEYGSHGTWTIGETVKSFDNGVVDGEGGNSTTWVEGNNYVVFKDIVPDEDGTITATGLGTVNATFTSQRCMLSGFQIVEVPEPATMSLLVLGGLAMLRRRRK